MTVRVRRVSGSVTGRGNLNPIPPIPLGSIERGVCRPQQGIRVVDPGLSAGCHPYAECQVDKGSPDVKRFAADTGSQSLGLV